MTRLNQRKSERSGLLFPLTSSFRVVRLGEVDARACSDELKTLTNMIRSSDDMYPNIGRWINEKVSAWSKDIRAGSVGSV